MAANTGIGAHTVRYTRRGVVRAARAEIRDAHRRVLCIGEHCLRLFEAAHALLELSKPPTAVFAANDLMALGVLSALRAAGLRAPDDLAVMGFDDLPAASLVSPALTTVTQFSNRLGQRAAELLFERLAGGVAERGRSEEAPFELCIRESA